jgi:hypothetical protein
MCILTAIKWRLEDLGRAIRADTRFGIDAKSYSAVELTQLYRGAMERLGDLQKAAGAVSIVWAPR